MTDVKLLPCPFCGGPAERLDFGPGDAENAGGSCIACTRCQSSGPVEFGRKENFVSNWNRRTRAEANAEVERGEAVAWLIEWRDLGAADRASSKRRSVHLHNAIADYRTVDPDATVTPLSAAQPGEDRV